MNITERRLRVLLITEDFKLLESFRNGNTGLRVLLIRKDFKLTNE